MPLERRLPFVLFLIFSTNASGKVIYTNCSNSAYRFSGYTYTIERTTGEKVWSHCVFPTPTHDHSLCGRPVKNGPYFLCDPDGLLDEESHDTIDLYLANIQSNTTTLCTASNGVKQSYLVAVLLINRIRLPDLKSSDLCINNCNELHPELATDNGALSEAEQYEVMRNFADSVRAHWNLGACDNDVLVLYCKQLNKMFISAGSRATQYLSETKIESMTDAFRSDLNDGDFQTGLLKAITHLADSLRITLRAHNIADALMITSFVIAIVFALFFSYYLFVSKVELNIFNQERPIRMINFCIRVITGLWFIQTMMVALTFISNSKTGMLYALLAASVAFVGCFVMYGIS